MSWDEGTLHKVFERTQRKHEVAVLEIDFIYENFLGECQATDQCIPFQAIDGITRFASIYLANAGARSGWTNALPCGNFYVVCDRPMHWSLD